MQIDTDSETKSRRDRIKGTDRGSDGRKTVQKTVRQTEIEKDRDHPNDLLFILARIPT